ncbi:MAG TPA: bifunctional oligoribonuclease/PAP phosphatase NrnA [Actinomycetota bacterium]
MDEQALRRAAEVLSGASEVALACHVNPDADALGAMLGLSAFLRRRGVVTVCSYGNEPLETPRWATLLPGSGDLVPPSAFPSVPAVMVTCDCASFDRLGSLGSAAAQAAEVIWIDHHRSHDGSGTIRLVDGDASSTCELVVRLIEAMGGPLDRDVAICLYAGLVTDTGRFQYQATTPETLRIAATLREHDFDHAELVRALYEDQEPGALRLLGTALGRMARVPEADVIWTYVTRSDMAEAGVGPGDTDDLIDVLRTARGSDVAVVLKQQGDGHFKVSMRSRGGHDLAAVAAAFGGGGHRLAAGYTSTRGLQDTIDELVVALREAP